jgi:hypothetical protein
MIEISEIERYLGGLYEAYDALHTEYKNLHKRSRMHDMETAENYYHRWKGKMLEEIVRVEKEQYQLIMKNEKLIMEQPHSELVINNEKLIMEQPITLTDY